jgi:hypothetical protein
VPPAATGYVVVCLLFFPACAGRAGGGRFSRVCWVPPFGPRGLTLSGTSPLPSPMGHNEHQRAGYQTLAALASDSPPQGVTLCAATRLIGVAAPTGTGSLSHPPISLLASGSAHAVPQRHAVEEPPARTASRRALRRMHAAPPGGSHPVVALKDPRRPEDPRVWPAHSNPPFRVRAPSCSATLSSL